MHEARRHHRLKIPLRISLQHQAIGTVQARANDMSDGGVYVLLEQPQRISLGEQVTVTTLGLGPNGDDQSAPLPMRVARHGADGLGLELLDSIESGEDQSILTGQVSQILLLSFEDRYLLQRGQMGLTLPERSLLRNESWRHGLENLLKSLTADESQSPLDLSPPLDLAGSCYPVDRATSNRLDMLIYHRLRAVPATPLLKSLEWHSGASSRWLGESAVSDLVDKLLRQA